MESINRLYIYNDEITAFYWISHTDFMIKSLYFNWIFVLNTLNQSHMFNDESFSLHRHKFYDKIIVFSLEFLFSALNQSHNYTK